MEEREFFGLGKGLWRTCLNPFQNNARLKKISKLPWLGGSIFYAPGGVWNQSSSMGTGTDDGGGVETGMGSWPVIRARRRFSLNRAPVWPGLRRRVS